MLTLSAQRGYSLVELIITMAIISLLLGAGIPSYREWVQNSQIRTAAESIQSGLQLTRAEAARRNTNVTFTVTGNDWSIDVPANATRGVDAVAAVQTRSGTEGTRNARLAVTVGGVAVTGLAFSGTGRVTPTPGTNTVFAVTNVRGACMAAGAKTGMRCLNVLVTPGGGVRMCDPSKTLANDPQGC